MTAGTAPGAVTGTRRGPVERAADAALVAAEWADEVDRDARFPAEAVAALRSHGLLAAAAPASLGGSACPFTDLVAIAETLAGGCSATAMVWAMHQIQLASLTGFDGDHPLREFARRVCGEQLLLASATSEVGIGGDIRTSGAALVPYGGGLLAEKDVSTLSYAEHADAILTTLRRSPDAAPNDQVMVVVPAERATLTPLTGWNALGMRGTCSGGYRVRAEVEDRHVLPRPFGELAAEIMVPCSHLLWAACWTGIAADALRRARDFLRRRERRAPGRAPLAAARLAEATGRLQRTRTVVRAAARAFDARPDGRLGEQWAATAALNTLKASTSQAAVDMTLTALSICGFPGYLETGPHSVARHIRDALSAPLMIGNDRLLSTNAALLLGHKSEEQPW